MSVSPLDSLLPPAPLARTVESPPAGVARPAFGPALEQAYGPEPRRDAPKTDDAAAETDSDAAASPIADDSAGEGGADQAASAGESAAGAGADDSAAEAEDEVTEAEDDAAEMPAEAGAPPLQVIVAAAEPAGPASPAVVAELASSDGQETPAEEPPVPSADAAAATSKSAPLDPASDSPGPGTPSERAATAFDAQLAIHKRPSETVAGAVTAPPAAKAPQERAAAAEGVAAASPAVGDAAAETPASDAIPEERPSRSDSPREAVAPADGVDAAALPFEVAADALAAVDGVSLAGAVKDENGAAPPNVATSVAERPDGANPAARSAATLDRLAAGVMRRTDPVAANDTGPAIDRARFVQRVEGALRAAQQRDGRVQVRLAPPELGALRIELAVQGGVMTAKVEAETAAARNALLDNLPALRERLAEQNIRVEKFDVDLRRDMSEGGAGGPREQFGDQREQESPTERGRTAAARKTPAAPAARAAVTASSVGLDVRV